MRTKKLFSQNGLGLAVDVRISPEKLVCQHIEQLLHFPGAMQALEFADGKIRLVGARADKDGLLVGQKISALKDHIPNAEGRIAAIYRDGNAIQPEGNTILQENDEVFFLAPRKDIRAIMIEMRHLEHPVRSVVIANTAHVTRAEAEADVNLLSSPLC